MFPLGGVHGTKRHPGAWHGGAGWAGAVGVDQVAQWTHMKSCHEGGQQPGTITSSLGVGERLAVPHGTRPFHKGQRSFLVPMCPQ